MKLTHHLIAGIIAMLLLQCRSAYIDSPLDKSFFEIKAREEEKIASLSQFSLNMMPSQSFINRLTAGFDQILSDYYWVKAVTLGAVDLMLKYNLAPDNQFTAEILEHNKLTDNQKRTLYELIRIATTYDPYFIHAYEYGSLLLAWEGYTDLGIYILNDGIRNNPESARLYNSMAFMHYFFLQDYRSGAYYAEKAFQTSKKGEYANPKMVAQLYAAEGDFEAAIAFLQELYQKPQTQMTRDQIETMIRYLTVEKDIRFLEEAVGRFIEKYKVRPLTLTGLVKTNIITRIPREPFGGKYELNTRTWKVENRPYMRNENLAALQIKKKKGPQAMVDRLEDPHSLGRGSDHKHEHDHDHEED